MYPNYYDPTSAYQQQIANLQQQQARLEQEMKSAQERVAAIQQPTPQFQAYNPYGGQPMGYPVIPAQPFPQASGYPVPVAPVQQPAQQMNPMLLIQQMQPYLQTEAGKSAHEKFNASYTELMTGYQAYLQNPAGTVQEPSKTASKK